MLGAAVPGEALRVAQSGPTTEAARLVVWSQAAHTADAACLPVTRLPGLCLAFAAEPGWEMV